MSEQKLEEVFTFRVAVYPPLSKPPVWALGTGIFRIRNEMTQQHCGLIHSCYWNNKTIQISMQDMKSFEFHCSNERMKY
jgi:hypothetical protein